MMNRFAEAMKVPYNPFNVKVKNVCIECKKILHEKIVNYQLIILIEKRFCSNCSHWTITQPYQKICSMCSKVLNICCMCIKNNKEDPTPRPQMYLFTDEMRDKYPGLTKKNRRHFMKVVNEKWKCYIEDSETIEEVKEFLTKLLRTLVVEELALPMVAVSKPNKV